jgi:transposase-like protein
MRPIYDAQFRGEIRKRMGPPSSETVTEILWATGISRQTLYSWRHLWKRKGELVPASSSSAEELDSSDKLASVIQAAGLSGTDQGAYCRERGLYSPTTCPLAPGSCYLGQWPSVPEALFANGLDAPSMADQKELQRKHHELIHQNRRLERELQKKEKALAVYSAMPSGP